MFFCKRVIFILFFLSSVCCFASIRHPGIHPLASMQKTSRHPVLRKIPRHRVIHNTSRHCGMHKIPHHPVMQKRKPFLTQATVMRGLMRDYTDWRGVKYKFGGTSRRGVDCSGYVQHLFRSQFHVRLPRTTWHQITKGKYVRIKDLKPGDLVFFKTGGGAQHVGVYVGHHQFLNASGSQGVTRSELYSPYWRQHYLTARRVLISAGARQP